MRYGRVIDAFGICVDGQGRTLLLEPPGSRWTLPGGPVEHGEHPADAVVRSARAQLGGPIEVIRLRDVVTDIDGRTHHDRIIFDVRANSGDALGTGGAWRAPAELTAARMTDSTARMLGLATSDNHQRPSGIRVPRPRSRVQRFAAYGLATDPDGNVLLTLIADRYPGAGRWHLPGGGTDFGESPSVGLAREITEETGQCGVIADLLSVSHRYQRDVRGPEGRPMDWHGVRVVYRVRIETPTEPGVVDHGGSTSAAAWFTPAQARTLPLSEVAHDALAQLLDGGDRQESGDQREGNP